jgi:hypothetical protein
VVAEVGWDEVGRLKGSCGPRQVPELADKDVPEWRGRREERALGPESRLALAVEKRGRNKWRLKKERRSRAATWSEDISCEQHI